jgi:hypothetical protein
MENQQLSKACVQLENLMNGMRNLLSRFFTFLDSDERALFRGFWFLFVLPIVSLSILKYAKGDLTDGVSRTEYALVAFSLFFHLVGARIIWNILNRERFAGVKNAVLVFSGFWFIQIAIILPTMLLAVIFAFFIQMQESGLLGAIALEVVYLAAAFVGGCWIGYKKDNAIWLWCVFASLMVSVLFVINPSGDSGTPLTRALPWFISVVAGGYLFDRILVELDATLIRREMLSSGESQNDKEAGERYAHRIDNG